MSALGVDDVARCDVSLVRELWTQFLNTRTKVGWSPTKPRRFGRTVAIPFPSAEVTPLKVYIAGFFDAKERLQVVRTRLEQLMSWTITSRWLDETTTQTSLVTPPALSDEYRHYANRDLADIADSDLLLTDTLDVTPRGGREVEIGYALGRGIPFIIVGPKRNVFHELNLRHFECWEDVYRAIGRGKLLG